MKNIVQLWHPNCVNNPSLYEDLQVICENMPERFYEEVHEKLNSLLEEDSFASDTHRFGAVAQLLKGIIDKYAHILTALEFAYVFHFYRVWIARGQSVGYKSTLKNLERYYNQSFESLNTAAKERSSSTVHEYLHEHYVFTGKNIPVSDKVYQHLKENFPVRQVTSNPFDSYEGHAILADLLKELMEERTIEFTDYELACMQAHCFRHKAISLLKKEAEEDRKKAETRTLAPAEAQESPINIRQPIGPQSYNVN